MAVDGGARRLGADEEYVSGVINQVVLDKSLREQLGFAGGSSGLLLNVNGFASLLECLRSKPTLSLFIYWVKRAHTAPLCVKLSDQDAAFRSALGEWLLNAPVEDLEQAMLKQKEKQGSGSTLAVPRPVHPSSAAKGSSNFSSVATFRLPAPPPQQVLPPRGLPDYGDVNAGAASSSFTAGSTHDTNANPPPSKPSTAKRTKAATIKSSSRVRPPVPPFSQPSVYDLPRGPAPPPSTYTAYGSSSPTVQGVPRRGVPAMSRGVYESTRRPDICTDSGWITRGRSHLAISTWTPPVQTPPQPSILPSTGGTTQRPLRGAPPSPASSQSQGETFPQPPLSE